MDRQREVTAMERPRQSATATVTGPAGDRLAARIVWAVLGAGVLLCAAAVLLA